MNIALTVALAIAAVISAGAAAISARAAAISARLSEEAIRDIRRQLEQTARHEFIRLNNQHNWGLFLAHRELPPALPSWRDLTDRGWAWRVLHFNHLNILEMIWADHEAGLLSPEDLKYRGETMGRFLFSHLTPDREDDPDISEGRNTLRQVLRPEEGYSKGFLNWLREAGIVPEDLFDGTPMSESFDDSVPQDAIEPPGGCQ